MIIILLDNLIAYLLTLTALSFWLLVFTVFFVPFLTFQFIRKRAHRIKNEAIRISQKYHIVVDPKFLPQIKGLLLKTPKVNGAIYNKLEDAVYKRTCWYMRKELKNYIRSNNKVLDIGSGRGYLDLQIQNKLNAQVTCLDIHNYSSVNLPVVLFDGVHIPFDNNVFDVVILSYVLHHSGEEQVHLLKEAKRVCKGKIIIYEDEAVGGIGQIFTSFHGPAFNFIVGIKNGTKCVFHSVSQWKDIFSSLHLSIDVCQTSWNLGAIILPVKRAFFVLHV
jgi:SAM-dependent methyltransferase